MTKTLQTLLIERKPGAGVKQLLRDNIIGTPGKSMVYQHLKTGEKLRHIPHPYFVSLVRNKKVLATCCFCRREANGRTLFYARYFSFHSALRKRGDKQPGRAGSSSLVREEIHQLLSGRYFDASSNSIFYAYIDSDNERSGRLTAEFGFLRVGSFASLVFSRWRPKASPHVHRLSEGEWKAFKPELMRFYSDHTFFTTENLFYKGNYFVLRENGEIVAGIQANPEEWKVYEMPGFSGKILIKVLPRFKLMKRIFSLHYHFVSIEGIYFRKGYESKLEPLMNHVLKAFGVHSAVLCLDVSSAICRAIKKLDLGLMSRLRKEKLMDIVVKENGGQHIDPAKPAYVSCFDVT